jgi:hypothetical protein
MNRRFALPDKSNFEIGFTSEVVPKPTGFLNLTLLSKLTGLWERLLLKLIKF